MYDSARGRGIVRVACLAVLIALLALSATAGAATAPPRDGAWQVVYGAEQKHDRGGGVALIRPMKYRTFRLTRTELLNTLTNAPRESTAAARRDKQILHVPMPDGTLARFRIVESPVMAPALAAKYPEIKTYSGSGIDDPAASGRFDWTPQGFHAQILSPRGSVYVDPLFKGDTTHYASYYKRDYRRQDAGFQCLTQARAAAPLRGDIASSSNVVETLRTYRLACAATGEYTAFHSTGAPSVAEGLAAIVTAINRVSGVYEREVAVRMELVANNDLIVYTDGATDPYTNSSGSTMLAENQSNIDAVIQSANYDFGHVFSTGGGGIAFLGRICQANAKARGVTGLSEPINDPFYIDFVAHEMGHQFGGNHPFNGVNGNCSGGNRNGPTAYEPGSGSTIQAYAGICGADNLQLHSDAYFHSISLDEIRNHILFGSGSICPVETPTGSSAPTVPVVSSSSTIPKNTPFELTAQATDPDGDPLTYCWEERDLGPAAALSAPDDGRIPLFRSFEPTTNPTRTFPKTSDILSNTTTPAEKLPVTNRTMQFRATVRDNHGGIGAISFANTSVTVTTSSGPFRVTSQSSPAALAGAQTVTWNVAGTTSAPVSAATVDILLSIDGGLTYPTVLASATPNDGSEVITLPAGDAFGARIKVKGTGNVFFDVSDAAFNIGVCAPTVAPTAHPTATPGNRYLSIMSGNGGQNTAIRVIFESLPPPFTFAGGRTMWVGPPEEISENAGKTDPAEAPGAPTSWVAALRCDPFYTDWNALGTVHVYDPGIVPEGSYRVQEIAELCDISAELAYTDPLLMTNSRWGDVISDCATTPCGPPDGVINVTTDVTAVLNKFKNLVGAPIKARSDLDFNVPDRMINISDVTQCLGAFRGFEYPFPGPDPVDPCAP